MPSAEPRLWLSRRAKGLTEADLVSELPLRLRIATYRYLLMKAPATAAGGGNSEPLPNF